MEDLSLEEKIAQMFIVELQEKDITDKTLELITKYKIGGFVLFRRNYDSYEEMIKLVNKLKEANKNNKIPLFISLDQEGGRVNRMPYALKNLKSAGKISSTKNVEYVKESSRIISKMLLGLGINLNYAPVLDIKRFEDGHSIGDRCFGDNKEDVCKYGIAFMKEMKKEGLLTAIKHFPGHGATTQDSHFSLPIVKKSKQELENDDLVPFKRAIQEGADAVMISHILVRNMDLFRPASLSREVIVRNLKRKYNYKGLIITDDLKMLAIKLRYSNKKAVRLAINAGNNIVMIGCKYKEIIDLIKDVSNDIKKNKIRESKINNSVKKIVAMKEKYNINDSKVKGLDIEKINKQIEELNEKVLKEAK